MAAPSVVELRQYTLHPGRRDELLELFDREFVESQEDCGIDVLGQFRDLDDPDRFVWLRGFPDMPARQRALTCFYGGPVWVGLRDQANATMADSSDVCLLRPLRAGSGFTTDPAHRPSRSAREAPAATVIAVVQRMEDPADAHLQFDRDVAPALAAVGATTLAALRTEHAENTFPRLPVRVGEDLLVVFAALTGDDCPEVGAAQVLRLAPTRRSLIR